MPQLIKNGPIIPNALLEKHEQGEVVFFCGAGISLDSNLPSFEKLTKDIIENFYQEDERDVSDAMKGGFFDRALNLVENKLTKSIELRKCLFELFEDKYSAKGDFDNQRILIRLAETYDQKCRIVTTNFDRLFCRVIEQENLAIHSYASSQLPIPKRNWDGIVYLHGLLPEKYDPKELENLVVTSSDFGKAYITEGWAARFITELFKNYTVCFIGYSLNDPVLRYVADAIAAEKKRGEDWNAVYSFCEQENSGIWEQLNIQPIPYQKSDRGNHSLIWETLSEWSKIYYNGMYNKKLAIELCLQYQDVDEDTDGYPDGLFLWAINSTEGARHFSKLEIKSPQKWLKLLISNERLVQEGDEKGIVISDHAIEYLSYWSLKHLKCPEAMYWIVYKQMHLNDRVKLQLNREIKNTETSGAVFKNEKVLQMWRLVASDCVVAEYKYNDLEVDVWVEDVKKNGLTFASLSQLKRFLSPQILCKDPAIVGEFFLGREIDKEPDCLDYNYILGAENLRYLFDEISESDEWSNILSELSGDFIVLLSDMLRLQSELGDINKTDCDIGMPHSISDHSQNAYSEEWLILIEICRDSWRALAVKNPHKAFSIAEEWINKPFTIFKRLALYAATHTDVIPPHVGLMWLLSDEHKWLWAPETRRESNRLVVKLAGELDKACLESLLNALIRPIPEDWYLHYDKPEIIADGYEYRRFLYLSYIERDVFSLENEYKIKLDRLKREKGWKLSKGDKDDFMSYIEIENVAPSLVPREESDLREYVRNREKERYVHDNFGQICQEEFDKVFRVLDEYRKQGEWHISCWEAALSAWDSVETLKKSWEKVPEILIEMPDDYFSQMSRTVAGWMKRQSDQIKTKENVFFDLIFKVYKCDASGSLNEENDYRGDLVLKALNRPSGIAAIAVLQWFDCRDPKIEDGLHPKVKDNLNYIFSERNVHHQSARVSVAINTVWLFQIDPNWTVRYLLPWFDWERCNEAAGMWQAFLGGVTRSVFATVTGIGQAFLGGGDRVPDLFEILKSSFLESAKHYKDLNGVAPKYANMLTCTAIDGGGIFTDKELSKAIENLTDEGLYYAIQTLKSYFDPKNPQRRNQWENRIKQFIDKVWPKTIKRTGMLSRGFSELCIAANDLFPEVYERVEIYMIPFDKASFVIKNLKESDVIEKYPQKTLEFLCKIYEGGRYGDFYLKEILEDIVKRDHALERTKEYQILERLV